MQPKSTKLRNTLKVKEKRLSDFVSYRGEYSSGRLISLAGSAIVFFLLIKNPENIGIQQLAMAVLGYSFASTTVSKFAKQSNQSYGNISSSSQEVWSAQLGQQESNPMGCTCGVGNRNDSEKDILQQGYD